MMTNSERIKAAMLAVQDARGILRDAPQFKVVAQAYTDLWETYEALEALLPEQPSAESDPHDAMDQGFMGSN